MFTLSFTGAWIVFAVSGFAAVLTVSYRELENKGRAAGPGDFRPGHRRFDQPYARARLAELGIPPGKKAGKLSGGQQSQLALTLALARRPRLLILDEPFAMLDPLARQYLMATVMTAMTDDGVSVLLSSHALAELERVADYLLLLSGGQLRMASEVDDLLASHRVLTGPASEADRIAGQLQVVQARRAQAQAHLLVTAGPCQRSSPRRPCSRLSRA
jgi:ABC-2 type transport system ATP-binding protein